MHTKRGTPSGVYMERCAKFRRRRPRRRRAAACARRADEILRLQAEEQRRAESILLGGVPPSPAAVGAASDGDDGGVPRIDSGSAEAQLAIVPSASELLQLVGERLIARGRAQLRRDEPVEQRRQRRQRPAGLAVDEHFSAASALRRYLIEGRVEPAAEVVVLASRLDDQIVERGDAALVLLLEAARHAGGMI